ncbi:MAG: LPS export ABC transporter permease LptF [Gammaproteobacteria bacterium]
MIIQRYIHQEILRYLLWLTGLLFLIMVSHRFVRYLADAAAGKIAADMVFQLLGYQLVATLPIMLPVALYLSVLLAFSRLLRDSELTIMSAAGMGQRFQIRVALVFSLWFAIPLTAVVFVISPWAEATIQSLQLEARQNADITGIVAGQFREFGGGDRVVYVEGMSADGRAMEDVFLQVRQREQLGVLNSERAHFDFDPQTDSRYIVFQDGRRYVGVPGNLDYEITRYTDYWVLIQRDSPRPGSLKLESMPTLDLLKSDKPAHRAELQWRLSILLAAFILVTLAVLLNRLFIQQKQYLSVVIAMLAYFVYNNLLGISRTMMARDVIPGWTGLWWVHLLMLLVIVALIYLPFFRNWRRKRQPPVLMPDQQVNDSRPNQGGEL